jgi:SAM-dependent methyltransferase
MVALARSFHPNIDFQEGDVDALPFEDASFDAVVCNFGLGHFPNAERAIRECTRILRKSGSLAVSWWDVPARQRIQGLIVDAVQEVGVTPPKNIPAGPPIYRYSEDAELQQLLENAQLASITVDQHSNTYYADSVETLWVGSMGSLARSSAVVLAQTPEIQARIRAAHARLASIYVQNSGLAIPISFKIAAGRRLC